MSVSVQVEPGGWRLEFNHLVLQIDWEGQCQWERHYMRPQIVKLYSYSDHRQCHDRLTVVQTNFEPKDVMHHCDYDVGHVERKDGWS